jgi:hypothetical protein
MKTKNLTLSEALATGLPMRKQNTLAWFNSFPDTAMFFLKEATEPIWEVKQGPREWTLYYSHMTKSWIVKPDDVELQGLSEQVKVREVIE